MAKINSKQKGNRGENSLAKILNERFDITAFKRSPSSGAYVGGMNRERNAGLSEEAKITLVSDLICPKNFIYIIEHKNYEKIDFWEMFNEKSNLNSWLEQVTGDAAFVGKKPLLIVKCNFHDRIVFVKSDFENIVFNYRGWNCGYLTNFLKLDIYKFFDEEEINNET